MHCRFRWTFYQVDILERLNSASEPSRQELAASLAHDLGFMLFEGSYWFLGRWMGYGRVG